MGLSWRQNAKYSCLSRDDRYAIAAGHGEVAPHWVALIGLIRTPCVQQKVTKETKNTNTVALIGLIRTRYGPRLGVNNRVWWQRNPCCPGELVRRQLGMVDLVQNRVTHV